MIRNKETVMLFGSKSDPEVKEALKKIVRGGRKVEVVPRPSHDTGTGPCGNHLCHCQGSCQEAEQLTSIRNVFGVQDLQP